MSKTCARCGEAKSRSDFYRHATNRDGLFRDCKACVLDQRKARYSTDSSMRARLKAAVAAKRPRMLSRSCRRCGVAMVKGSPTGRPGMCVACKRVTGYKIAVSREQRLAIYERDGWVCQICGREVDAKLHPNHTYGATLDHVAPRSTTLFVDDSPENLRLAHRSCNSSRGNRTT